MESDMEKFDVLVIGGGPGGTPAALVLAAGRRRVLLVEQGSGLGGTCLFEGCIPSKILHESARRLQAIQRAAEFGLRIPAGDIRVDWPAVMARKAAILRHRAQAALEQARRLPTLRVQFGRATLLDPRRARITPGTGDPFEIEFTSAIIATGSTPSRLAVPGVDLPRVLTSEQILEIERLPASLIVIGGGPVGVEMAQIFAAFGTKVTLFEAGRRILAPVDEEIALGLQAHMARHEVSVQLDTRVNEICHTGDGAFVQYHDQAGTPHEIYGEYVLEVTGRRARVDGLGLEQTAVRLDRHGIRVNDMLETDEPGLYAVGDVVGRPMFAHWASAQAQALARHLLGHPARFPTPAMNTAVVFSIPEIGIAGLTEGEAREAGHDVDVARYDFRTDARAQVAGDAEGLLKLVYDRTTRLLLGAHMLADGAASTMGEAALALGAGVTMEVLASSIHPHPTLSESFGLAARSILPRDTPREPEGSMAPGRAGTLATEAIK
jgi:dihydrolipoamide dehydrogenase